MAAIAIARIEVTCSVGDLTEHDLHMWLQNAIAIAVTGFTDNYPRRITDVKVTTRTPEYERRLPVHSLP